MNTESDPDQRCVVQNAEGDPHGGTVLQEQPDASQHIGKPGRKVEPQHKTHGNRDRCLGLGTAERGAAT